MFILSVSTVLESGIRKHFLTLYVQMSLLPDEFLEALNADASATHFSYRLMWPWVP
jgi:hypothetical protein